MIATALIPAFDEARTIAEVVRGTAPYVHEVLVVDDGSSDDTASIAEAAGATVLRLGRNQGKGCAVRAGLARVLDGPSTHVVFMDGDLQHRPAEVPRLLAEAERTGAAMVIGERRFDRATMPAARYWANVIGSWALATLMGVDLRDTQSGFRVVRTDALRAMKMEATRYEFETELIVKLARRGASFARVEIPAVYASEKSHIRPVRDTTRNIVLALVYRFLRRGGPDA